MPISFPLSSTISAVKDAFRLCAYVDFWKLMKSMCICAWVQVDSTTKWISVDILTDYLYRFLLTSVGYVKLIYIYIYIHDIYIYICACMTYSYIRHWIQYNVIYIIVLFSLSLSLCVRRFLGCPSRYCQMMFSLVPCIANQSNMWHHIPARSTSNSSIMFFINLHHTSSPSDCLLPCTACPPPALQMILWWASGPWWQQLAETLEISTPNTCIWWIYNPS